jgi:hypothetical protein
MLHIRRYFLEAIAGQLKTLSDFGGVWIQRIEPTRNIFPCITLYADAETCETLTIHNQPRPQDRVLTVSINAWIRGTVIDEKAEQDMDNAALSIESAMYNTYLADDVLLMATDFKVSEGEPEIHVLTLTYHIFYNTTEFLPVM